MKEDIPVIQKIKQLLHKYRELITYAIFGALTTLVNFIVYFLCKDLFHIYYITSNIIAWFVSVLFAFFTNKLYVFQKKDFSWKDTSMEFMKFAAGRVLSGAFETGFLYVTVDFFHLGENLMKLIASIVVVIINYAYSKLFVFINTEEKKRRCK
jgi:putative flippase GtrA